MGLAIITGRIAYPNILRMLRSAVLQLGEAGYLPSLLMSRIFAFNQQGGQRLLGPHRRRALGPAATPAVSTGGHVTAADRC
jgi:hypothetical protein